MVSEDYDEIGVGAQGSASALVKKINKCQAIAKSSNAKSLNQPDAIVLLFYDTFLRQSDVETLLADNWLHDSIISFYFEYLERIAFKDYDRLLFISPQVTQCIKITDASIGVFVDPLDFNNRDFVFFALNDNQTAKAGGTHWSLLVYSRCDRKMFHFDSAGGINHDQAWEFSTKIIEYTGNDSIEFEESKCLQQTNGYDCGIHVICNAENVAQHVVAHYKVTGVEYVNYEGVVNKRQEILDLIEDLKRQGFT